MTKTTLNPTIEEYRGSVGKLVFKKYKGRTIVAKKPVRTKEPGPAELARREHFKEAVAYAKSVLADPAAREFYKPISFQRDISIYALAVGDFLKKPTIKPLDLTKYKGQIGDPISIRATDDIGLADLDVKLVSDQGTLIEQGKAVEIGVGSGKWTYTATASVALGSDIFIELSGVDHAGNRVKYSESPRVGEDD